MERSETGPLWCAPAAVQLKRDRLSCLTSQCRGWSGGGRRVTPRHHLSHNPVCLQGDPISPLLLLLTTNRYFIHRQTSQSTRNVRNAPSWPQNYLTSVFTGSIRLINFHLSAACRCRVLDPQQNGKYPSRFLVPIAYFCIFTGW